MTNTMTDTTQYTSPYTGRPITEWIDPIRLEDVDGDKVGEIVEVNPDFVVVREGHWLSEDEYYYVPRSQITEGTDSWSLTFDKDDLEKNYTSQYAQPPQDSSWSQDTYRSGRPLEDEGTGDGDRDGRTRLRRYEEQLQAQKTPQQVGEVTINKRVVEDRQTIEVPVMREEVRVERRPFDGSTTYDANGAVTDGNATGEAFQGETIRVPVMEEQVEIRKVARPVEEIEISKVTTQDTRQVDDTIRREEFDVDDPQGRATNATDRATTSTR
jgi:uncharacterized protein (TIGR02271 family)